ncbi:riboflavin synthase [Peptoniphilus duerdenii]|uniref:riboflavin synthase n=1 Tax=Peptoniphilus duerdenii TaxID=507750 RepID=UPI00288AEE9D|nr:riboflavin synthase [Peptoniphilus duerdenii]
MFTGIIEEQGRLNSIRKEKDLYTLNISAKVVLEGTKLGDSIATDGVCLTVTKLGGDYFEAEAMLETINNTTFKELKGGEILNLERALSPTKRLDGHIVQGHVDGVGKIINTTHNSNEIVYKISAEEDVLKYVVNKGSIALDGISLTVSNVDRNSLEVSIIPTTIRETNLKDKKLGDSINIETDIIGRYVYKFLNKEEKNSIDLEFLRENGF